MRRRRTTALLMGLTAFALVAASAASFGGLNVVGGLGAEAAPVAACTSDGIDVSFESSFDETAGEFVVDTVLLSETNGSAECAGTTATVVLFDADPTENEDAAVLDTITGEFDTFKSLGIGTAAEVLAEGVEGVAVSIVD